MRTPESKQLLRADMTEGNISSHLLRFALPLLAGNLFQLLYSFVDAWVVGNYVSDVAFSAVGAVAPAIDLLINFFSGFASGAGAVISQYCGAKDERGIHDAAHTAAALALLLSLLLSGLGVAAVPGLLRLMRTPGDVYPEAFAYLTIYCAGMPGLLIYNMNAAILQATGDSRRPFRYLMIATVCNIGLDFLLVLHFGLGVYGVAFATVAAQLLAALLTIFALLRTDQTVQLRLHELRLHREPLGQILRVGLPAALQMAITALSNVFVQSYINQFGKYGMGGWAAFTRLDSFFFLPAKSFSVAAMTFVGQNFGGEKTERARRGVARAVALSLEMTLVLSAVFFVFAPQVIAFFNDTPQIVYHGVRLLRWNLPFYGFVCIYHVYAGAFRGSGRSRAAMVIMLFSFVLLRQLYLYVVSHWIANALIPLSLSFPVGWISCAALLFAYDRLRPMDAAVLRQSRNAQICK